MIDRRPKELMINGLVIIHCTTKLRTYSPLTTRWTIIIRALSLHRYNFVVVRFFQTTLVVQVAYGTHPVCVKMNANVKMYANV